MWAGRTRDRPGPDHPPPATLPQRSEHQTIAQWGGHPEPRGDGPWVGPRRAAWRPGLESSDDGRAPRGLHAVEAWRPSVEPAGAGELPERLPHADQSRAATRGVHDRIGQSPAELLRELEPE